jgi:PhoPQ-activated pathogenicity-related protein
MASVVEACVIMHNMIVKERMGGCKGIQIIRLHEESVMLPTDVRRIDTPKFRYEQTNHWRDHVDPIESLEHIKNLKLALMEHIWTAQGAEMFIPENSE